jgi:hypothetical protein
MVTDAIFGVQDSPTGKEQKWLTTRQYMEKVAERSQ